MANEIVLGPIEMSVLHDAFEIARDTLTTKYKADSPRIDVLAKLIIEIGQRRVRAGVELKAEVDAQSVASFATAILTKTDPC
jgi:hypothetical protein